jgi:hypothetical protein
LGLDLASARLRFSHLRFLSGFRWTDPRFLVACLGLGFFVRLVPELLAFPLPIGFDTIYYANVMKDGVIVANWSAFFASSWLLFEGWLASFA